MFIALSNFHGFPYFIPDILSGIVGISTMITVPTDFNNLKKKVNDLAVDNLNSIPVNWKK